MKATEEGVSVILVVNGPNLNLLGQREPNVYGSRTLHDLETDLSSLAKSISVQLKFFQSNSEGAIIDFVQEHASSARGMILNPGAFTHYSYAIRDAVEATRIRTVEVHISNIHAREEFRHKSVIAPVCIGQISGLGFEGYLAALRFLVDAGEMK